MNYMNHSKGPKICEICHKFLRILIPRYDKSNVPLNSLSRNSNMQYSYVPYFTEWVFFSRLYSQQFKINLPLKEVDIRRC